MEVSLETLTGEIIYFDLKKERGKEVIQIYITFTLSDNGNDRGYHIANSSTNDYGLDVYYQSIHWHQHHADNS